MQFRLKHQLSYLQDCVCDIKIDKEKKMILLNVSNFDSALIIDCIVNVIPKEFQIISYEDDNKRSVSEYSTRLQFSELTFFCEVVKLKNNGTEDKYTIALNKI